MIEAREYPAGKVAWTYRIMFAGAAAVVAVAYVFFFIGIADGSVSSFNLGLWIGLIVVVTAIIVVGHRLHAHGRTVLATILLSVLAVPGALYALFILLVIASGSSWN